VSPAADAATARCLVGPAALVSQRLASLLDQWLTPASRCVDYHTFQQGQCPLTDVLDELRLLPMAGPCRVVVLRGIERAIEEELLLLEHALAAPAPTGRLLLIGDDTTPPALLRRLADHHCVVEQLRLETSRDRLQWAANQLAAHGQSLEEDARPAIEDWLRDDAEVATADQRLEQLSLYAGERRTISRAMVERLVQVVTPSTVFAWAEAVGSGEVGLALQSVTAHAADAHRVPELIGVLGWQFRRLWTARLRLEAGAPLRAIARDLRIPPRAYDRWSAQVQRWTVAALREAAQLLLNADRQVKRGEGEPRLLLELLVARLATVPDARRAVTSSGRPHSDAECP